MKDMSNTKKLLIRIGVWAAVLAAVVIGEELGTTALVGAAIVVVGIIAYNVLKARFPTEPESMENPV